METKNCDEKPNRVLEAWKSVTEGGFGFTLCLLFTLPSIVSIVFWAVYHQYTGILPFSHRINLLFWGIDTPFKISRLWDPTLGPVMLVALSQVSAYQQKASGWASDFLMVLLLVSFVVPTIACIFGVFTGLTIWLSASVILYCIWVAFDWYMSRRTVGGDMQLY